MKRQIMLGVLLAGFFSLLPLSSSAQENPAGAAERLAAAEREQAEDRYKRMSTDIEDLKTALQSYHQRQNELREELRKLSEEVARQASPKDIATKEDFKHLADKIREVDEKRIADNERLIEKVTSEFARLGKSLAQPQKLTPNNPPAPLPPRNPPETKTGGDKGYEYTIRDGDNPGVISKALGKQGVKISAQQIRDANPAIADWTKLRIGQKIFIPAPTLQ